MASDPPLFEEDGEAIVETAILIFQSGIVQRETVEVRDDGTGRVQIFGSDRGGVRLDSIETENAEMVNGDAIHEQAFHFGSGAIVAAEHHAKIQIGCAAMLIETGEKDFIAGGELMLQSIEAGLGFSGESLGSTSIPGPFPTS